MPTKGEDTGLLKEGLRKDWNQTPVLSMESIWYFESLWILWEVSEKSVPAAATSVGSEVPPEEPPPGDGHLKGFCGLLPCALLPFQEAGPRSDKKG